jgi:hypothetical protein
MVSRVSRYQGGVLLRLGRGEVLSIEVEINGKAIFKKCK